MPSSIQSLGILSYFLEVKYMYISITTGATGMWLGEYGPDRKALLISWRS